MFILKHEARDQTQGHYNSKEWLRKELKLIVSL